jgi:hypothetical protein
MELEFSSAAARGLARYVRLIASELDLAEHGYYTQLDTPAHAYLALDTRAEDHPTQDAALVWDEVHGWAVAVESRADLVVLSYLGDDVLPAPRVVAALTRQVLAGTAPVRATPPALREADDHDDLPARLASYARTVAV